MLALLLGLGVLPAQIQGPGDEEPVRIVPGSEARGRLARGQVLRFELSGERGGEMTVIVESEDFDAKLVVNRDGQGIEIAADAGIEGDEWALVDLSEGQHLDLNISAAEDGVGNFLLRVLDRAEPGPGGDDRWRRTIERLERRAYAAGERGDPRAAALALDRLYDVHLEGNALLAAREDARRFLEVAQTTGLTNLRARALAAMGTIESLLHEPECAAPLLEQALALQHAELSPSACIALHETLGHAWTRIGRADEGLRQIELAIELARAGRSPDVLAPILARFGSALIQLGRIDAARPPLEEAMSMLSELKGGAARAYVLGNQGLLLQVTGEYRLALEAYERALEQEPPLLLRLEQLGSRALVHYQLDMLDLARVDLEESRRLSASLGLEGLKVKHLHLSANVSLKQGRLEEALGELKQALALAERGSQRDEEAELLVSLGAVQGNRGDLLHQRECFQKLREMAEEDRDERLRCRALRGLGASLLATNELDASVELLRESADIAGRLSDAELEADAVGTLAWAQYLCGLRRDATSERSLEGAIENARRGVSLYDDTGKRLQALEVLETLACAAVAGSNIQVARESIASAEQRLEEGTLEEEEGGHSPSETMYDLFAEHAQDLVTLEARLASDANRAGTLEQAWRAASAWRSRSLLRALVHFREPSSTPSEHALRAELEAARAAWEKTLAARSAQVRASPSPDVLESLLKASAQARARYEDLRSRLLEVLRPALSGALRPPPLSEVQQVLADRRTALIEYAPGCERLYAYAVTQTGLVHLDLGPREKLEKAVQAFVGLLRGEPGESRARSMTLLSTAGKELERLIVEPVLAGLSEEIDSLVIVPSGDLCALSFEALPLRGTSADGSGGSSFLIERYAVAYAPSAAALVELARRPTREKPRRSLILADPRYAEEEGHTSEAIPTRARGAPAAFDRLRHTREEACSIAIALAGLRGKPDPSAATAIERMLRGGSEWSADSWVSDVVEMHVGAKATRGLFLDRAGDFSHLHLATHGFADSTVPEGCGIALSWEEGTRGLVLSRDILDMRLDSDLTVLSACDTGIGPLAPRHGPLSLARAFLHAGSRAVIASLWEADDLRARELMERFYAEHLGRGLSAFRALRLAKLQSLRAPADGSDASRGPGVPHASEPAISRRDETRDPYRWAAFVYFGLPR